MARKSNVYKYGVSPYIGSIRRTKFTLPPKRVITTMTPGKLYPVRWEEVLPGSNWKSDVSFSALLTSAYLRPPMDDLYLEEYTFAVPLRILQDDLEDVFGNSNPSAYDADGGGLKQIDTFQSQQTVTSKTVADYLGLPVGKIPAGVSVLPFRAFAAIWEEWFRNQQVDGEMVITGYNSHPSNKVNGIPTANEKLNNNAWSPTNYMGQLPSVTRMKDYFSTGTPSPQKGAAVPISPAMPESWLPLDVKDDSKGSFPSGGNMELQTSGGAAGGNYPLYFKRESGNSFGEVVVPYNTGSEIVSSPLTIIGSNLGVTQTPLAAVNVNDLRMAFALQRMQELDIFGGRYREYLLAHYNVNNGDARMQIPEFLGGHRQVLFAQKVAQTSAPSEDSPLAALGGYSDTVSRRKGAFSKAFTEHCIVMTVACIRYRHTYQQGINVKWTRKQRQDFYDPTFAHVGNQPVFESELYTNGTKGLKDTIFTWKEAWAEYKSTFNEVTGEARSAATNSLDIYHFADNYASAPVFGQEWLMENTTFMERDLAVQPSSQDPFIVDFCFMDTRTLPMPVNCYPGLIDHRG